MPWGGHYRPSSAPEGRSPVQGAPSPCLGWCGTAASSGLGYRSSMPWLGLEQHQCPLPAGIQESPRFALLAALSCWDLCCEQDPVPGDPDSEGCFGIPPSSPGVQTVPAALQGLCHLTLAVINHPVLCSPHSSSTTQPLHRIPL